MKTYYSLAFIFVILSNLVSAQHYQALHTNNVSYFEFNGRYSSNEVRSIAIDSVVVDVNGDTVFYPTPILYAIDYECFSPTYASWVGKKVIVKNNGDHLFFNMYNEPILIKSGAKKDDQWITWSLPDSVYVEATVVAIQKENFLGLTDSVKTIAFKAYDKAGQLTEMKINSMEIKISRSHGFLSTLNYYQFPNYQDDYFFNEKIELHELIGMTSPKIGFQNLTMRDVFDFQPGDELHILEESSNLDVYSGIFYSREKKIINRYLTRTDLLDTIIYSVEHTYDLVYDNNGEISHSAKRDTLTWAITVDKEFDQYPGIPDASQHVLVNYYTVNAEKPYKQLSTEIVEKADEYCWYMDIYDCCFKDSKYIKGLGGPYYSCNNPFSIGGESRSIHFYKKGTNVYGMPYVITEIEEEIIENQLDVFPNPAAEQITVLSNSQRGNVFHILTVDGRTIFQTNIIQSAQTIDISSLSVGIYMYQIKAGNEIIDSGKLIIER